MWPYIRMVSLVLLLFPVLCAHAIQVNVQTQSKGVFALGFTVNKKSYGGMGHSYTRKNMPMDSAYSFGLRAGGLMGDDVTCYTQFKNEKKQQVTLTEDSAVALDFDGKYCSFRVFPLKKAKKCTRS